MKLLKKLEMNLSFNSISADGLIVVMKDKRYTFRDDLTIIIPIITSLISIATFIITLSNN